jgi:short-subunit dehydrogenase
MKKAIVVGASSGIGRALAEVLAANGYEVGLASRRLELLSELASRLPTRSYVRADSSGADVRVTDVKPGFVETAMTEGQEGLFWVAPVEVAARQIYTAIRRRRRHVYVTRRWRLVAWLMRLIPYPLLVRLTAGKGRR